MYIDSRYYVDPIKNSVVFINPTGGNLVEVGVKAVLVTNQLGGGAFESAIATDADGIRAAFNLVQRTFPGVPLKLIDNGQAKQNKYQNVGRMNFNLSTSPIWIAMNDLAIVHPVAMLIRQFEETFWGKPMAAEMKAALEQAGIINQVIP